MAPTERIQRLIAVVRFGPELFPGSEFIMFLYHAERLLTWTDEKESDASSYRQITDGIYSRKAKTWVRRGAGISKASAVRANEALERRGVLMRSSLRSDRRGHEATRYVIDWRRFDELLAREQSRPAPLVSQRDKPLSHGEPSPCLTMRHTELDRVQNRSEQKEDIDCLPTNRKRRDSSAGCSLPVAQAKQYPRLREMMARYMADSPNQAPEDYPSDRAVVDTMEAARWGRGQEVSEHEVMECLRYLYNERGLRRGTRNGPRHFSWFKTVVQDYFSKATDRDMSAYVEGYEWVERIEAAEQDRTAEYAAAFDPGGGESISWN